MLETPSDAQRQGLRAVLARRFSQPVGEIGALLLVDIEEAEAQRVATLVEEAFFKAAANTPVVSALIEARTARQDLSSFYGSDLAARMFQDVLRYYADPGSLDAVCCTRALPTGDRIALAIAACSESTVSWMLVVPVSACWWGKTEGDGDWHTGLSV